MKRRANWRMLPFAVFVRIPVLLPFFLVAWVGEQAEKAGGWLSSKLPGMDRQ